MIYFVVSPDHDLVKIGYSVNPVVRTQQMQRFCPCDLYLLGSIDRPISFEGKLHLHLAAHNERGEWFRKTPEVMATIHGLLDGSFDEANLPQKGKRSWAIRRRAEREAA